MKNQIKKICGIYTITNIINNKIYVGYSTHVKQRFKQHREALRKNKCNNIVLQRAWNKYGEENFLFEVLEECDKQYLCSEEHYWATLLNVHDEKFGYNLKPTHPSNKYLVSISTRVKRSNYMKKITSIPGYNKNWNYPYTKSVLQFDLAGNLIKEWNSVKEAAEFYKTYISTIVHNIKNTNNMKDYLTAKGFLWLYKEGYIEGDQYKKPFFRKIYTKKKLL